MRSLAQPGVLKSAVIAALLSALACYPRLFLWVKRPYALWYLETVLFLCGIVLWAFVFGWHTKYTGRPVLTLKVGLEPFVWATLAGVTLALLFHNRLDPSLRLRTPEDYPSTIEQWLALTLFNLAFTQLYLVFAAYAWFVRLFQNLWMAGADFLLPRAQATRHNDLAILRQSLANGIQRLLHGGIDKAAGVHHHQVRILVRRNHVVTF